MRLKKMDVLTTKKSVELELPQVGRSIFEPDTKLVVSRVNNRYVYARTDGGSGLGLIIEVRMLRKSVQHDTYHHEPRSKDGISELHAKYFESGESRTQDSEPPSEPTVIRRPRRAS